jgi:hypothetical protein
MYKNINGMEINIKQYESNIYFSYPVFSRIALNYCFFLDFVHRPVFYKLENTTFRKPYLLPFSCEGGDWTSD